jgi:hypothetical protein
MLGILCENQEMLAAVLWRLRRLDINTAKDVNLQSYFLHRVLA